MKKKFFSFILAICLIIPCAFIFSACDKDPGGDTPPEPVHHGITIRTFNNLNDRLESIVVFCGDREAITESNIYSGTIKEGEENVFITLTTKPAVKYTEDDVILVEKDNKGFNKSIEVKNNGLTQNIIEITITNITSDCFFKLGLEDSNEIHTIASMPIEFNYDIRYYNEAANLPIVVTSLESAFYDISIWSDKAQRFISYNNIKADNTLNSKLELNNIKVNDFKVYVHFATAITFNSKTLRNLVVLRDSNGEIEDVPLTFNPQSVKKGATECYEYSLDISKLDNVTNSSKIVLNYEKYLGSFPKLLIGDELDELSELVDYRELDGHKFSQASFYVINLTENVEIFAQVQEPSPSEIKKLNEKATYKIKVWEDTGYIDSSKIDVYVGNKETGIKAEYNQEDDCHYVTIPDYTYPSTYGNAECFYLTVAPSDTVQNIDEVLATEHYDLLSVTTVVDNVAMHKVTENLGNLWRTELSQDGKTQIQFFVVEKDAKDAYDNSILPLNKKFYYANYDDITIRVTFNGHINYINIDFKTIYRNNLIGGGTLDLLCDDQHYNIQQQYNALDTSYIEYTVSNEYIEFKPI